MGFLSFIPLITGLIDKIFPDAGAADKMKLEMLKQVQEGKLKELEGSFDVVRTEGASEHWLVAAWRPITMLTFLAMIVAWWFGYTPENVTEPLLLELFSLIKIGLGGYVVGRSAEKVAKILRK